MMKKLILAGFLFSFGFDRGWVCAQQARPPFPYGPLPSQRQLNWQEMNMYCIVHFGLDTYTDKEWGYGDEDPALFNPTHFDARQIVAAAKAGGFKGILVVAKHHDGFCLWPTATTAHNISQSPFRNGKGDMVREYQAACRDLGMQLGIYCSPWDRNSALYGSPAYVDLYRRQLQELYTGYGKLFISWHDGANGGDGYYGGARTKRLIDKSTYYGWDSTWAMTRRLQPSAAIFSDIGWDIRWVGNEEGEAGQTCWATYTPHGREEGHPPANGDTKYWEATEGQRDGQYWMPAECDVPLRPGWFYHAGEDSKAKSPYTLFDLYFKSVGRGADLDLGLSPNRDGVLVESDVKALKGFGDLVSRTFAVNLARGAILIASNIRAHDKTAFGPAHLLDNDRYSYWATDDSVHTPVLECRLGSEKTFNIILLRENIKLGQRIESVGIDARAGDHWEQIAEATSIGANRLIRLPAYITTSAVRIRVTRSPVCIALSDIGLFAEPLHLAPPLIRRDKQGEVSIATPTPVAAIRYTTDGSEPDRRSVVYRSGFALPLGGIIRAAGFDRQGHRSESSVASFGLSKAKWTIWQEDSSGKSGEATRNNPAARAIDDDPATVWQSKEGNPAGTPGAGGVSGTTTAGSIAVDMGERALIRAFTYLPRQHGSAGIADKYRIDISSDGSRWSQAAEGEFSNIRSNPIEQTIALPEAITTRFFRFTALHTVDGYPLSVAELGVVIK